MKKTTVSSFKGKIWCAMKICIRGILCILVKDGILGKLESLCCLIAKLHEIYFYLRLPFCLLICSRVHSHRTYFLTIPRTLFWLKLHMTCAHPDPVWSLLSPNSSVWHKWALRSSFLLGSHLSWPPGNCSPLVLLLPHSSSQSWQVPPRFLYHTAVQVSQDPVLVLFSALSILLSFKYHLYTEKAHMSGPSLLFEPQHCVTNCLPLHLGI